MPRQVPRILPYFVLTASVCLTGMTGLAPRPDHSVAAVFPPWWGPAQAFNAAARAGGVIVRTGAFPTILVIAPGPPGADLSRRLHQAGAFLLLDAQALGACSQPFPDRTLS
jgi:hypothetical protein